MSSSFTDTIEKIFFVMKSQFLLEVELAFIRSMMVCFTLVINGQNLWLLVPLRRMGSNLHCKLGWNLRLAMSYTHQDKRKRHTCIKRLPRGE
jgi:hypothetical protein